MTTRVVHCRRAPFDVYIGRLNRRFGLPQSPFANPFRIGKDGTRQDVLQKYRDWLLAQPGLVAKARRELRGKVLGCWCKPQACHGDVLAAIVDTDT